ncbi:MAG: DegT/DnrJ/EryC1/StrS family aminotransferase [Proteobacteria bacterium]|nr:DegT/DnrJ/EryC1/StrS family aminotransferase [Pseudomonadota bacterium]
MPIPKIGQDAAPLERPLRMFPSAREAFRVFLAQAADPGKRVLLPAYIGWSAREGSGVFDPIAAVGLTPGFYRVDAQLHVDLEDLERQLVRGAGVVVLIHYFGHVDPGYREAVALARRYGALIVEDEAHAMLTDLYGGTCGRLGDVCLFSLHKLLPMPTGGALVVNPSGRALVEGLASAPDPSIRAPWDFDLHAMVAARRANAALLAELLAPLAGRVDPLWTLPPEEVPQTFAVKIRGVSRDVLYERMNARGFGVVSLYHTMITPLSIDEFPISHELARTVMNLPVHQEATADSLRALVVELGRQLELLAS